MSMSRVIQAIRWISNVIWSYLARPFRRSSMQMELPIASPNPPSTPSFIQHDEPDIAVDAMRIFRLNYGPPRASRIARNKSALREMRDAPPNNNRIASLCSTGPSPGFSLLNDVVDNIVPSDPDCPSVYSSPPSSPSSSLHTPCIIVSSTMGEIVPERDEGPSGFGLRQGPRIVESDCRQDELSHINLRPDTINLAKRRDFKGPPILTNVSRDTLLFPTSRPAYTNNPSRETFYSLSAAARPRSALATVTDFVRGSATHVSPRSVSSREAFMASPESQAAYNENSPFSVNAESFFVEDHIACPPVVNIYDIGIYADPGSLLNLQPPKRKRNVGERGRHKRPSSSHTALNSFGKMEDLSVRGSRLRSFAEDPISDDLSARPWSLTEADMSTINVTSIPTSRPPSPVLFVEKSSCLNEGRDHNHLPSVSSETGDRQSMSARLALYASLIFPFSLEDSVCPDDVVDIPHPANDSDDLDIGKDLNLDVSTFPDPIEDIAKLFEVNDSEFFPTANGVWRLPSAYPEVPLPTVSDAKEDSSHGDDCFPTALACSVSDFIQDISPCGQDSLCASDAPVPVSILPNATAAILELELNEAPWEKGDRLKGPLSHVILPVSTARDYASRVPRSAVNGVHCSQQSACAFDRTDYDSHILPISCESGVQPNAPQMTWPVDSPEVVRTSDDLEGLGHILQADGPQSEPKVVNRRRERRVGIYGGLPSPLGAAPQDKSERSDLRSSERRNISITYSTSRESKRGSPFRPLILPKRLAIRELGDAGGGSPPFISARSSIGRPPPFPLPDVPIRKSSSASAVARLTSTRLPERFQTVSEPQGTLSHNTLGPEGLERFSSPAPIRSGANLSNEMIPYDENSGSNHPVNWGIAF